MRSRCDKMEVMVYDKVDEVVKELFESHLSRYQHLVRNI